MYFQKNILKRHLSLLPQEELSVAWDKYKNYFLDPQIQDNIRHSKEEQFQEGFLRELFVNILGYTLNPSPNYNLITEQKNESNAKKADGAILLEGKVIGVIELKDHKTTDLKKVEPQAFQYKNQNKDARYVIISNFEKLNFYIDNSVEYREWSLFTMTEEEFQELYLCLAWTQIQQGVAIEMKKASVSSEDQITNRLYRDYSLFKKALFADIVENNPVKEGDEKDWQLLLYKKSQKFLDRLLFIFFAEDGGLLPPNSMIKILDQWQQLKELDAYVPLYHRIKQYFGYLNDGNADRGIYAYNGGLFKPDEVLDSLIISDDLLNTHTRKLSEYDFKSDVDVNILGHIFEHSLSEIEEVTQQIMGVEVEASKSKRKKDGVFYTPPYITKYIVENTVGKLCAEKKQSLDINEEEYFAERKRQTDTKKRLLEQLRTYREWLLQITILDPACGSGAFLNAALTFLMNEHKLIDEMEAKVTGSSIVFQDIENSILENNLFGVDINEESVEIAQLALWLRTAKPQSKLSTLSGNIKCGNSLISDPAVAGNKAFDWQNEFPQVFDKGGFDVVIGNPPYVRIQGIKSNQESESLYYENNYVSAKGRYDLYILFIERALSLINSQGCASYILPHNFMSGNLGEGIRAMLSENHYIESIVHFGSYLVFEEALTYTCIIRLSYNNEFIQYLSVKPSELTNEMNFEQIGYEGLGKDKWNLTKSSNVKVLNKIQALPYTVSDFFSNVGRGIVTGMDDCFILRGNIKDGRFIGFSKALKENIEIETDLVKPLLMGNSVHAFSPLVNDSFIIYPHKIDNDKTVASDESELEALYPMTYAYLSRFKEILISKKIKYKTNPKFWYALHNCRDLSLFTTAKIIAPYLGNKCQMSLDAEGEMFTNDKCSILKLKPEYASLIKAYLSILNSRLVWFFISNTSSEFSGGYFVFSNLFLNPLPIPDLSDKVYAIEEQILTEKTDKMLLFNEQIHAKRNRFLRRLSDNFQDIKITGALSAFDQLTFAEFMKELKKQKIKLSLSQQDEWVDYFNDYRTACQELSAQIATTNNEIDLHVYKLYGLTYDEVLIVDPETPISREEYEIKP